MVASSDTDFKETTISSDYVSVICYNSTKQCDINTVFVYDGVSNSDYRINIIFNLTAEQLEIFEGVSLEYSTASFGFNLFAIILRGSFFIISLAGLMSFVIQYRRNSDEIVKDEYRLLLILSISLVLFNDPFFAITTIFPSIYLEIFSAILVTNFYQYLLQFWMTIWWQAKIGPKEKASKKSSLIISLFGFGYWCLITIETIVFDALNYLKPAITSSNL